MSKWNTRYKFKRIKHWYENQCSLNDDTMEVTDLEVLEYSKSLNQFNETNLESSILFNTEYENDWLIIAATEDINDVIRFHPKFARFIQVNDSPLPDTVAKEAKKLIKKSIYNYQNMASNLKSLEGGG